MKCPHCKKKYTYAELQFMVGPHLNLASDGSYISAETGCIHCDKKLDLYFPLTEINGKKV